MKPNWTIDEGHVLDMLAEMPAESVHCVATSPPYWGLRDYGESAKVTWGRCDAVADSWHGQLGLEPTIDMYVEHIVEVFRAVRRVLRKDGTLWLNVGDSYTSGNRASYGKDTRGNNKGNTAVKGVPRPGLPEGLLDKNLIGQPWRIAFALQAPYAEHLVREDRWRSWLAAVLDTDGCIGLRHQKSRRPNWNESYAAYVSVSMCDREVPEKCAELAGGSVRIDRKRNTDSRAIKQKRDRFCWRVDANAAVRVLRDVWPYLLIKQKQAACVCALDDSNKSVRPTKKGPVPADEMRVRRKLYELVKAMNQRRSVTLPLFVSDPREHIEDGWILRSDIIWAKSNPMPESVIDRPTKSHEHVFLFAKSQRYFWDAEAVREGACYGYTPKPGMYQRLGFDARHSASGSCKDGTGGSRNLRDVWTIPTEAVPDAHFATFPRRLATRCIQAGTSERGCCPECGAPWRRVVEKERVRTRPGLDTKTAGRESIEIGNRDPGRHVSVGKTLGWAPTCKCVEHYGPDKRDIDFYNEIPCAVLDPFCGSGQCGIAATQLGRSFVGIEINPEYAAMARRRIANPEPLPGIADVPGQLDLFAEACT